MSLTASHILIINILYLLNETHKKSEPYIQNVYEHIITYRCPNPSIFSMFEVGVFRKAPMAGFQFHEVRVNSPEGGASGFFCNDLTAISR